MSTDTESCNTHDIISYMEDRIFKLMRGKNGTTSFFPKKKKGEKVRFCEEVIYIYTQQRKDVFN